jgi:hypothetical protein
MVHTIFASQVSCTTEQCVAPNTVIVLWDDNEKNDTDAIQLEYSYVGYDQVVSRKGVYHWRMVDEKLAASAKCGHQSTSMLIRP